MQICANAVFITPSKPQNFSSKQILSKEKWDQVGQLVETTHPNEHTLFCSVYHISFKYLLAHVKTAQDTGLCYLAFCPAAHLWSLLAALLALVTVFVLTVAVPGNRIRCLRLLQDMTPALALLSQ